MANEHLQYWTSLAHHLQTIGFQQLFFAVTSGFQEYRQNLLMTPQSRKMQRNIIFIRSASSGSLYSSTSKQLLLILLLSPVCQSNYCFSHHALIFSLPEQLNLPWHSTACISQYGSQTSSTTRKATMATFYRYYCEYVPSFSHSFEIFSHSHLWTKLMAVRFQPLYSFLASLIWAKWRHCCKPSRISPWSLLVRSLPSPACQYLEVCICQLIMRHSIAENVVDDMEEMHTLETELRHKILLKIENLRMDLSEHDVSKISLRRAINYSFNLWPFVCLFPHPFFLYQVIHLLFTEANISKTGYLQKIEFREMLRRLKLKYRFSKSLLSVLFPSFWLNFLKPQHRSLRHAIPSCRQGWGWTSEVWWIGSCRISESQCSCDPSSGRF